MLNTVVRLAFAPCVGVSSGARMASVMARASAAVGATRASSVATSVNIPHTDAAKVERTAVVDKAVESKISKIFYDDNVKLSKRQKQVFSSLVDEPPMPLMEDHGFLYRTNEEELAGVNDMVKRALSTRTANIQQMLAFKKSEILRKFAPKPFDTGASRVQVAMLTERINRISTHSGQNKHDKNCKRSLTALTVRRRKLLEYMMRNDYQNYRLMIRELNLRPLPLFNSRHLPKVRTETHKQVKERHARLKNRVSRGNRGH